METNKLYFGINNGNRNKLKKNVGEDIMERLLQEMIQETKYELFHYPVTTKKQDMKYWIKRLIKPSDTPKRDPFFWPHAMLTQALESAGETDTLKQYYDAWLEKGLPIYNIDNVMNGFSLLYVYEQTKEEKYKKAAHRLYEYICNYKKEMNDTIPYRKHHPKHIYADGIGMICPFLCRYGALTGQAEAIDSGLNYIQEFLQNGMDAKTGLPYHGYDLDTKVKYGIIGWGRAVGWLLLGMADSLKYIPEGKQRDELWKAFCKLIDACSTYLREDGYFSWQLTALEGPKDTSGTAMTGYALQCMKQYAKQSKISHAPSSKNKLNIDGKQAEDKVTSKNSEKWEQMIERMKQALILSSRNGKIYDCSGECEGFSQYPQIYGAYPWSLGPGVRFLLAADRKDIY